MVISDAPYGVHTNAIGNKGRTKHPDFVQGGGEQTREEFVEFLQSAYRNMSDFSIAGSAHFLFMDHGHTAEMLSACTPIFGRHKNLCVWVKANAGMGACFRSQHELVWLFKKGTAKDKMINNFGLGETGRYRSNCWFYKGMAGFSRQRDELLKAHPTVKPCSLISDAIRDCSKRGGIVLDGFAGSGTIFIAAEKTGRRGYGIELDPKYADVCVKRWQAFTAEEAVLLSSGKTFSEVAVTRSGSQQ